MVVNCTNTGTTVFGVFCGSFELLILLAVVITMLVFSVCCNIVCCIAKLCSDKGKTFLPRFRRSLSLRLRDMEDNPIYGNISYTQTRVDLPLSSSSIRKGQAVKSVSQTPSRGQDCYANLTLKAPKTMSGRSSPKIEYSDVVTLCVQEVEKATVADTDTISVLSDLYASVQTDRTKTLDTVDSNNGYANHV